MNWPSLSVVIPTLNMGRFIERTLLSIFRQNYPGRLQVIVADGGSTDETVDILKRYPQIVWWSRKDGGIADAVNQGFAAADGEILAEQGSDDYYLPGAFQRSIGALVGDPGIDIVAGTDVFLQPDGQSFTCSKLESHEITPKSLLMRRVIPLHCGFFRRAVLDTTSGMRCFGKVMSQTGGNVANVGLDIDFWYRALHLHRGRFVPYHTAVYQLHAAQMTSNSAHWYANMTAMVESCENDPRYGQRFRLSDDEKRNMYVRWQLLQERLLGREDEVNRLIRSVLNEPGYTQETRLFLVSHGFLPRPRPHRKLAGPAPDLHWWMRDAGETRYALAG